MCIDCQSMRKRRHTTGFHNIILVMPVGSIEQNRTKRYGNPCWGLNYFSKDGASPVSFDWKMKLVFKLAQNRTRLPFCFTLVVHVILFLTEFIKTRLVDEQFHSHHEIINLIICKWISILYLSHMVRFFPIHLGLCFPSPCYQFRLVYLFKIASLQKHTYFHSMIPHLFMVCFNFGKSLI